METNGRRRVWVCVMVLPLALFYGLIRYGLFALHGMRDWTNILAAFVLIVLSVALLRGRVYLAVAAVLGYGGGFGFGLLFGRNGVDPGGGTTSSLWVVWTVCLVAFVLMGVLVEVLASRKRNRKQGAPHRR